MSAQSARDWLLKIAQEVESRWAEVTRVLWSDDLDASDRGLSRQWVQLVCKTISDASEEPL